jgi:predicted RNase H-like nuclease (RuvC/YqgF family)
VPPRRTTTLAILDIDGALVDTNYQRLSDAPSDARMSV